MRHDGARLLIWVLENNPARAFYERMSGYRLAEAGYGWDDIRQLVENEETNHAEDEK